MFEVIKRVDNIIGRRNLVIHYTPGEGWELVHGSRAVHIKEDQTCDDVQAEVNRIVAKLRGE